MVEAIKGCGAKSPASPPMSMAKFKADLEVALAPEARAKWAFVLALAIVAVMAARLYESITEAHAVPSRMHGGRASGPNRTPLSDTASLVALSCALWLLALQVMPEGGGEGLRGTSNRMLLRIHFLYCHACFDCGACAPSERWSLRSRYTVRARALIEAGK